MKYLLPVLLVVSFFIAPPAHAQAVTTPTIFYCVGNNPQPPCVTMSPSQTVSQAPSTAPSVSAAPSGTTTSVAPSQTISSAPSGNPSPSTTPCSTSQNAVKSQSNGSVQAFHHGHHKRHSSGGNGFLQQFIQFLLQLLQQLFQQLGINIPIPGTGSGCPTPAPSSSPSSSPSSAPSSGVSPSAAPSGTSTAPSTSPSTGVPTPTIFGTNITPNPAAPTATKAPAATQTKNCVPNPHLCGFPDATNTGVPAGTQLTASGTITVTTNGAVVDAKDVKGTIEVKASNVTIKRTRVTTNSIYPIRFYSGFSNLTIEDVEVAGSAGCLRAEEPEGSGVTMIRMNVHGCEDGVQMDSNESLTDSYIHDLSFTSGAHNDGIQQNGGSNDIVRHNTIFNPNNETSCVNFTTDFGSISNITIDNNLLDGGNYTVYSRDASRGSGAPTGVKVTNNHFGRRYVYGLMSADGTVSTSGNVWDDTGAAANP